MKFKTSLVQIYITETEPYQLNIQQYINFILQVMFQATDLTDRRINRV